MNKFALITSVAACSGVSKMAVSRTLDAMTELLAEKMKSGDRVTLSGFGTFRVKHRLKKAENGPKSCEECLFSLSNLPSFKAGRDLKNMPSP